MKKVDFNYSPSLSLSIDSSENEIVLSYLLDQQLTFEEIYRKLKKMERYRGYGRNGRKAENFTIIENKESGIKAIYQRNTNDEFWYNPLEVTLLIQYNEEENVIKISIKPFKRSEVKDINLIRILATDILNEIINNFIPVGSLERDLLVISYEDDEKRRILRAEQRDREKRIGYLFIKLVFFVILASIVLRFLLDFFNL